MPDNPTPSNPSLTREHLKALYDISRSINSITDIDSLLEHVMEVAIQAVEAERGFLVLSEDESLRVRTARNISAETAMDKNGFSRSIVSGVIESHKPVLTMDAQADQRFEGAESLILKQIRAVACVPFHLRGRVLGAIYLDAKTQRERFTTGTLSFLSAFADLAAIAIENARLMERLREENRFLRSEVERRYGFSELVGNSSKMQQVFSLLNKIIQSDISTLFEGESGTGKELAARALHYNGPRREKPFVAQFCGNYSEHLLESELFGHKKGSFTGAVSDKRGLLEVANGGTFFLDEVADIPPRVQAKLLRVLQDGKFKPVGGMTELYSDVLSLPSQPDDQRVVKLADQVHRQIAEHFANLESRVHRVTLVGNPAKEIVEFAMNMNVSMIVAGTRGQTPATELYLGSVSSTVAHRRYRNRSERSAASLSLMAASRRRLATKVRIDAYSRVSTTTRFRLGMSSSR